MPSSPVWSASSPENSGFTGVWRLLRPELIPEKRRIALLGAIVLISTAISYLSPWLQRKCINALEIRVWEPAVLFAAAVFSAIAAARLLDAAETYLVNILNTRIGLSLKRRMLGSLARPFRRQHFPARQRLYRRAAAERPRYEQLSLFRRALFGGAQCAENHRRLLLHRAVRLADRRRLAARPRLLLAGRRVVPPPPISAGA